MPPACRSSPGWGGTTGGSGGGATMRGGGPAAEAAARPILAGLVRYEEVQRGAINHAVRVTVGSVQKAWVHPATHYGTSSDPNTPPYGTRLRLRADYDQIG